MTAPQAPHEGPQHRSPSPQAENGASARLGPFLTHAEMIDALVHGRLVHRVEADQDVVIGRIVTDGGKPIQFIARRGAVRRALMALPPGFPVAAAGSLSTSVASDKDGQAFVRHDLLITALLTAEPSTSGLAAFFRKATSA